MAICPSADLTGDCLVDLRDFAVLAGQWQGHELESLALLSSEWLVDGNADGMVWVFIDDPGIPGYQGFFGEMSKYETTNAQYARYLNAAMADGLLRVNAGGYVYAYNDTSLQQLYCILYPSTATSQITYSDGQFSVRTRNGYSMDNHPVVRVTWYGATAFCDYYGYRLPSEWEWQAVADYDGSFFYGCGSTINSAKANYGGLNPLRLTTSPFTSPVGYYPEYGYGLHDMAGNVNEWTSSASGSSYVLRGGSWNLSQVLCEVRHRSMIYPPTSTGPCMGFRVCR